MKKIKNIVVAIDFSVTSRHAYCYAAELSKTLNATLTVVHAIDQHLAPSDMLILETTKEDNIQLIKDIELLVEEENYRVNKLISLKEVGIKLINGDPVTSLVKLSENDDTDLIVMGTTGLSDVLTKVFGSTSQLVSNKAHCPVILIPRGTVWQQIKKIVFASNSDSMTTDLAQNITDFATNVSAEIHFVNVKNYDPLFEHKQTEINWKELTDIDSTIHFEKHTVYGNDTIEQLKKYSEEKNINLIAFASKHRNFWENLMHKSITERSALSSITPIMVIHMDDVTVSA